MKNIKTKLLIALAVIIVLGAYYYVMLPAINIHSSETWVFLIILGIAAAAAFVRKKRLNRYNIGESKGFKVILGIIGLIVVVYLAGALLSSPIINAKKYQQLMKVEEGNFF